MDEEIPFEYDTEKLLLQMRKPTQEDLDTLQSFELTAPYETKPRQKIQVTSTTDIPISKWRKQLGFGPEEVIQKTIDKTTQYYLTVECEECEEPCRHFKPRVPA